MLVSFHQHRLPMPWLWARLMKMTQWILIQTLELVSISMHLVQTSLQRGIQVMTLLIRWVAPRWLLLVCIELCLLLFKNPLLTGCSVVAGVMALYLAEGEYTPETLRDTIMSNSTVIQAQTRAKIRQYDSLDNSSSFHLLYSGNWSNDGIQKIFSVADSSSLHQYQPMVGLVTLGLFITLLWWNSQHSERYQLLYNTTLSHRPIASHHYSYTLCKVLYLFQRQFTYTLCIHLTAFT
jgi:hypothetical protein